MAAAALPAQTLIWPGESIATIDAQHLRAFVPAAAADQFKDLVARADQIYAHMQQDAGFVASDKLRVLFFDWQDDHNGYSFVVPFPLVQVQLAPSLGPSTIFAGGGDVERTLIHEFAHQISNDRNHGLRGTLQSVFGRVLPNDLLSLLVWYASTPAHQTMPRFWLEGVAVWAETAYADAGSAWAGRGRDALTHMVWRLDAAANRVPEPADWRVTFHEWPFGNRAYVYGNAYTRWLAGRFGDRASMWRFVDNQARQWPFLFDRGARAAAGESHAALLRQARAALLEEQQGQLAKLRREPVTELVRRTPLDMQVGAPAWLPDGALTFGGKPAQGRARRQVLDAEGELDATGEPTWALGSMRALPDGGDDEGLVYEEFTWRRMRRLVVDGQRVGWRMLQPDAGPRRGEARTVTAIRLRDGGGQELVVCTLRDGELDAGTVVATHGTPWTPTLRPGNDDDDELAWVETDRSGSRLMLGSVRDAGTRIELWAVRGRLLHPAWSPGGRSLYVCADHTGVANAYRIDLLDAGSVSIVPITNTLGGVIACVPSPDRTQLALVDHDTRGPFVATLANDPAGFARAVPQLALAWPAPGPSIAATPNAAALVPTPIPPAIPGAGAALTATPYRGLEELRGRFWTPTTFAVPTGGYGVYGLASDPLLTHVVQAGVGAGLIESQPVAFADYSYLAEVIEFGVRAGRSERTFAETVRRGNRRFDYTELVTEAEVRAGRGLFAIERQFVAYVAVGVEDHDEFDRTAKQYAGGTSITAAPFRDTDGYVEATVGYDGQIAYPTSYAREDGLGVLGVFRHSGLFGELQRNTALGDAGYTWSLFPRAGHQVIVRGQAGWSDGEDTLQSNFSIGGGLTTGLPRGYLGRAVATGRHLLAASFAYRFPLWRPFAGYSTAPFRGRQLVLELFCDTGQVSRDRLGGNGAWFTSVGGELHLDGEFFDGAMSPGLGVAYQLDGEQEVRVYFALGFAF